MAASCGTANSWTLGGPEETRRHAHGLGIASIVVGLFLAIGTLVSVATVAANVTTTEVVVSMPTPTPALLRRREAHRTSHISAWRTKWRSNALSKTSPWIAHQHTVTPLGPPLRPLRIVVSNLGRKVGAMTRTTPLYDEIRTATLWSFTGRPATSRKRYCLPSN